MKRVTSEGEWTCTVADTPLAALPPRPPFQHFGETGRLAAPFVATAARFAIKERTLIPFINRFTSEQSNEYSGGREARGRTRGNWWPDVAAAYFINSGELVSVSDKR